MSAFERRLVPSFHLVALVSAGFVLACSGGDEATPPVGADEDSSGGTTAGGGTTDAPLGSGGLASGGLGSTEAGLADGGAIPGGDETDPAGTVGREDGDPADGTGGSGTGASSFDSGSPGGIGVSVPEAPAGFHWEVVDVLTDEFNGDTLDSTKWDDYHPHWSGRPPSKFKEGECFVDGKGLLSLRSTLMKDPSTVGDEFSDIWVNAAACVSKEKSAEPGFFYEARMKASSLSMTSSFWFRVGDYSEIDVIEHIGNPSKESRQDDLPYQYHANTHFYGTKPGNSVAAEWEMPTRGRDEFHTYGFWWKDGKTLWFYHNGTKVMEITPSGSAEENLKMVFDTEVFPFASAGVANIGLPLPENLNDETKNTMYVDWVHTYRLVAD